MEQRSKNSISGPSKTPFPNALNKEWKIPSITEGHRSTIDTSLFSSSLPLLRHEKLNFNESEQSVHSIDDSFPSLSKLRLEEEVKDPLEDIEQCDIGSFLPGDEEELLAGLMDDFDLHDLPTQLEDLEDDLFGSGGGLEIETDPRENLMNGITRLNMSEGINGNIHANYGFQNGLANFSGEHPYGEHPSRTLFVRNINSNVEDSELRSLFEQYGDVRTLYTACKHRGFVMISYYDIRAARTAMRALQNKPLRRRKLDIHFSIPKDNPSEKDMNQGTLVVFNLDSSVTHDDLLQIFGAYGKVKEVRETPYKRHHKFIEFYDVRAAEAALKALNRCDIAGKRIKLEPSRPGGTRRSLMQQLTQELELDDTQSFLHQVGSPVGNSPTGSWSNFGSPVELNPLHGYSPSPGLGNLSQVGHNNLPGLASILPSQVSNPVKISPIATDPGRISHSNQVMTKANTAPGTAYQHHNLFLDPSLSSSHRHLSSFNASMSSSIGTLSGPQFLWGSSTIRSESLNSSAWSTSSKGRPISSQGYGYPYPSQHGSFLGSHNQVGSAPSGIQLERRLGFFPESPETSYMNPTAFGGTNFGHTNTNHVMNMGASSSRMMPMSRNVPMYFGNGSYGGGIGASPNDVLIGERGRSRKADSGTPIENKNQYQLDLEKIINSKDTRTTLMIKNIPNKYTSKMLLAAIDETHKGTYDFIYLPIDFKNKCNVGYSFINMISPSHIITFYEAFNGKKWEKFNSEKVASLAYARIQGKKALISHFENSSLMNEDKRCRPILFQPEGRGSHDLECLPSSNLNVFIRQPDGSYIGDSLDSPKGDHNEMREKS